MEALRKLPIWTVLSLLALCPGPAAPALAAEAAVEVSRLPRPPVIADFLDMRPPEDLAPLMPPITGFVQRTPDDGRAASQRTQVYMGYDDLHVYVVFVAFDDEPEKIRAHVSRRENISSDDTVEIQIDSFNDQRRAYSFLCNPLGVQWDAIWTEGQGFDMSWDTVWQSRGQLTAEGYVVWMAIPFKSLRFRPPPGGADQTWRIIFVRDIVRNNETSFWPRVSSHIEGRLSQSATATGFAGVTPGRNLWLIPYTAVAAARLRDRPEEPSRGDDDWDAGLDVKWVLRDQIAVDVTANPDFSQVESDQPQVTVNQRFEVFFPEKRPFFLENADYFRTPIDLLFTRRIVDPRVGGRLTGRVGSYEIGALLIDDEAPAERATNSVFRLTRDLGGQSSVGLLLTDRSLDGSFNRVGSLDARIRLGDNWNTRLQAAFSDSRDEDPAGSSPAAKSSDSAYNAEFNRDGRRAGVHLHYQEIGPEFRTDLGFVQRRNVRDLHGQVDLSFWSEDRALTRWRPVVRVQRITNHDGVRVDENIEPRVEWDFRRRTGFGFFGRAGRERLIKGTDYRDDVGGPVLPGQLDFPISRIGFSANTAYVASIDLGLELFRDRTANFRPASGPPSPADRNFASLSATLRPGLRLKTRIDYLYTRLEDRSSGTEILANRISRARFDFQFNNRLSLRAILQREHTQADASLTRQVPDDRISGDLLMTYLVNPWSALYVGYTTNSRETVRELDGSLTPIGDRFTRGSQIFAKLSFLFRP